MIDLEKILELEANAYLGPWEYRTTEGSDIKYVCAPDEPNRFGWECIAAKCGSAPNGELIAIMRSNIRQLCLELKAAREYFSKDIEVRQISLKDGLQAASNAWQDREDLLQKYYEVKNGKG